LNGAPRAQLTCMKIDAHDVSEQGKIGWALAWLLGVPLPLLLIIYLFSRAC
jgi:hypothetical protein